MLVYTYTMPNGQVAIVSAGSRFDPSPEGWAKRYHAALVNSGQRANERFNVASHRLPPGFIQDLTQQDTSALPPRNQRASWRIVNRVVVGG